MSLVSFKNIFTYGETSTMRSYIPATPATLFAIGLYPRIAGGPGEQHQCRDDGEGEDGGPQHRPALPSTKPKAGSVTAARGDRGREVLDRAKLPSWRSVKNFAPKPQNDQTHKGQCHSDFLLCCSASWIFRSRLICPSFSLGAQLAGRTCPGRSAAGPCLGPPWSSFSLAW